MTELSGRSWTNTLRLDSFELESIPILVDMDEETQERVSDRLDTLLSRDVGNVFEELGTHSPATFSLGSVREDRRQLDELIFAELNLSTREQLEVYKSVLVVVRDRLMRQPAANPSLCETIARHNEEYDFVRG